MTIEHNIKNISASVYVLYMYCIPFAVLRLYIVLRWQWVGMVFHDVVIPFLHSFISVIFMTRHRVVYVHSINRRQFLMILSRDITEASESLYWQSNFGIFNKNNKKRWGWKEMREKEGHKIKKRTFKTQNLMSSYKKICDKKFLFPTNTFSSFYHVYLAIFHVVFN